jgi:integrase
MGLKGTALKLAFEDYLSWSIGMNRRKATVDEIRWFTSRFLEFVGERELSSEVVQKYIDKLLTEGIGGRKWQPNSVKNDFKIIKKISNWLVKKERFNKVFKLEDFIFPEVDNEEEFNLAELPSIEVAREIMLLGTEPKKGDHKLHRKAKLERREAFEFMLITGIRVGELEKMKGSDLKLDAEVPSYYVRGEVSKSRKSALLPLSLKSEMLEMLRKRESKRKLFDVNKQRMNETLKRGCEL